MSRAIALVTTAALAVIGCGGGDSSAGDAAPERTGTPTPTPTATATPAPVTDAKPTPEPGKCDEVKYQAKDTEGTVHPNSNFFEPDATDLPTEGDLGHLLLRDNAIVVIYAAGTPKKTRERLYDWTYQDVVDRTPVVVPDPSPDALPVRARIATLELRCNGFDFKRLTAFANRKDIAPLPGHG